MKYKEQCFIRYPNTVKCVEKRGAAESFFKPIQGGWIPDETLFRMFDIASQTDKCGIN